MYRAHKIELRPTLEQLDYFNRCSGCMRFVYNQLVDKISNKKEKYNRKEFQKFASTLRKTTKWMNEVTSRATYEAVDNFHKAMTHFFDSCKGKRNGKTDVVEIVRPSVAIRKAVLFDAVNNIKPTTKMEVLTNATL